MLDHQIWSIMMIFYENLTKKVEKVMKINSIKKYVSYGYYKNENFRKLEYLMVMFFHIFGYFFIKILKNSTILLMFWKMNWKMIWFRMIYKNNLFRIGVSKKVVFIVWKNKIFRLLNWNLDGLHSSPGEEKVVIG